MLAGGAGIAAATAILALPGDLPVRLAERIPGRFPDELLDDLGGGPDPVLPAAPAGDERLERRVSAARGREVDFYTAVPAGHGDGWGLPVCVVLHGGSKSPRDFAALGLGRFLTAAVDRGAPPFVLAGATGDRLRWRRSGTDDPQRMVDEEIPAWCAERGFDTRRIALWGWSMGGYGALRIAGTSPGPVRSVAAFSPAVTPGDDVFGGATRLRGIPVGLWCGRDDDLYDDVRALHRALPEAPAAGGYADGRHNFGYWSRVIPAAFGFLGSTLR
jgi:predicted esterase